MVVKRQDAWTTDDDMVLAEVILRHIREGGTQLSAFEEVAAQLGRTPAACGFRWNSTVRKKYETAIQMAKQQRQKRNQERNRLSTNSLSSSSSQTISSIDQVIRFLRQYKHEVNELKQKLKHLENELMEREEEIKRLEHENNKMKSKLVHERNDYQLVNDDYHTLVQIMERARKMAFLTNEENEINTRNVLQVEQREELKKTKK